MEKFTINPNKPTAEQQAWQEALEQYMVQVPNDWIAKWLYGGMDAGLWEESMYADILREWYGSSNAYGCCGRPITPEGMLPEPAWMSDYVSRRGEDIRGPLQWEEWEAAMIEKWGKDWNWLPSGSQIPKEDYYPTALGQATELRPIGAQANLTTEQLDQLMSYLSYTKAGKPASRKEYLETMAYKTPGWVQDYMSTSQSLWPTVAPPRARMTAAWQR